MKKLAVCLTLALALCLVACSTESKEDVSRLQDDPDETFTLLATIVEITEGHFLVEPVEGSPELNSANRIDVPPTNTDPSSEPKVGDTVEIIYNGEIAESYPAQIADVVSIKVVKEADTVEDPVPMVMVNDVLYVSTGLESTMIGRCGVMDGEITSTVDSTQYPTENNQSNFGTGYSFQFTLDNSIEILIDGKWIVFESEQAKQPAEQ